MLLKALGQSMPVASKALSVVQQLLSQDHVPLEQVRDNMTLISRMHGLSFLANLLCPADTYQQQCKWGKSTLIQPVAECAVSLLCALCCFARIIFKHCHAMGNQCVDFLLPAGSLPLMDVALLSTTQHRQLPCSHTGLLCAADATLYSGGAGSDDLHDVGLEQHLDMVQSVIQLMTQLLHQTQWQKPNSSHGNTTDIAQAPSASTETTDSQAHVVDSPALHVVDNISADADSWMACGKLPSWPTPSAATWADINAAATRAAFTLEPLAPQVAPDSASMSAEQLELRLALIGLLHSLLAGHIMDPQLDMRSVFLFAMVPLLREWQNLLTEVQPLNTLCSALLARLAIDKALLSTKIPEDDEAIWDRELQTVTAVAQTYCESVQHIQMRDATSVCFGEILCISNLASCK